MNKITIPKGYRSLEHYIRALRVNLGIAQRTPRYAHLIDQIKADLLAAEQVKKS